MREGCQLFPFDLNMQLKELAGPVCQEKLINRTQIRKEEIKLLYFQMIIYKRSNIFIRKLLKIIVLAKWQDIKSTFKNQYLSEHENKHT